MMCKSLDVPLHDELLQQASHSVDPSVGLWISWLTMSVSISECNEIVLSSKYIDRLIDLVVQPINKKQ